VLPADDTVDFLPLRFPESSSAEYVPAASPWAVPDPAAAASAVDPFATSSGPVVPAATGAEVAGHVGSSGGTAESPQVVATSPPMGSSSGAPASTTTSAAQALTLGSAQRRSGDQPTPVNFQTLLDEAGLGTPTKRRRRRARRRKRHPFRFLFRLVILLGLLGGTLYLGKVHVYDRRWDPDLEPVAERVANERGLAWKRPVRTEELPAEEYTARLASGWLGIDDEEFPEVAAEWRAMGLAEGEPSLAGIGAASVSTRPVFYDLRDRRIYIAAGVPDELRQLALDRALVMALLDQHHGLGDGLDERDLGVRAALLSLFDGDANATSFALAEGSAWLEDQVVTQVVEVRQQYRPAAEGAPRFAVDLVSAGGGTRFLFETLEQPDRDQMLRTATGTGNGAGVYDGARALDDRGDDLDADPGETRGLAYWYYALAARIPAEQAWEAALTWQGDRVSPTRIEGEPGPCFQATIATSSSAQPVLLEALRQWEAAAPTKAATAVTLDGPDRVRVTSCDPGPNADTIDNTDVPAFGESIAEARLIGMTGAADQVERACVVRGVRGFEVVAVLESGDDAATEQAVRALSEACVL
jgi:hypothetical protein